MSASAESFPRGQQKQLSKENQASCLAEERYGQNKQASENSTLSTGDSGGGILFSLQSTKHFLHDTTVVWLPWKLGKCMSAEPAQSPSISV